MRQGPSTVTVLFTDLLESSALLSRVGDERGDRIFRSHRAALVDAASAHGGQVVKWIGDGLMVTFESVTSAVRSALDMQRASARTLDGDELAIRVGVNVGDVIRDGTDYTGAAVVVARRLCDDAQPGQVLCSKLVGAFIDGSQEFEVTELGPRELKGIPQPVPVCEVRAAQRAPSALEGPTPFVGRTDELRRLGELLREADAGKGRMAMLVGEPGIGKTRTLTELAALANAEGATVLWGRCTEGEWTPYAPFREAVEGWVAGSPAEDVREVLGPLASPLSRLAPRVRDVLTDVSEPADIGPDEERMRLFDATARLFENLASRATTLVILDDLHWADGATIALLRYVARFVPRSKLFVVGAYRDVELDRVHPLAEALGELRRETSYERVRLSGLATDEISQLLTVMAHREVPSELIEAIRAETDGNPFFIREVVLHLVEEGRLYQDADGRWTSDVAIADIGIPEGVREVIGRRLSRLSDGANDLLRAASGFEGAFVFEVAAEVSGVGESKGLDALDEALRAGVIAPAPAPDTYAFTHALIRHALYGELNPSRQVRLHRQIAERLEVAYADDLTPSRAGEIARQYERSAALPRAEQGARYAEVAAEAARSSGAHEEAASLWALALELIRDDDPRVPRLLVELAQALVDYGSFERSRDAALRAIPLLVESEGAEAAMTFIADFSQRLFWIGGPDVAWPIVDAGLELAGDRHDLAWAQVVQLDVLREEIVDPDYPGIPLDHPARREAGEILKRDPIGIDDFGTVTGLSAVAGVPFADRDEARRHMALGAGWVSGDYAVLRDVARTSAAVFLAEGRFTFAGSMLSIQASAHTSLGELDEALACIARAEELLTRFDTPRAFAVGLLRAKGEVASATLEGIAELTEEANRLVIPFLSEPANAFHRAAIVAYAASAMASQGQSEVARLYVTSVISAIERAPGWAVNYTSLACRAAEALWFMGSTEHLEVIERNLREKVIAPDFHYPMCNGELSLARLLVLDGRYDEAHEWFDAARSKTEETKERPLRAIVDHDEATMLLRTGDDAGARQLFEAALVRFDELGMTGWSHQTRDALT